MAELHTLRTAASPTVRVVPVETVPPPVRVELRNLTRDFVLPEGTFRAVDGVSLAVRKGEFVSLIGPSGSGKSTILNMIPGLLECTSGEILIDGQPVQPLAIAQKLGYVFQKDTCYPWRTVRQNISLGLEVTGVAKKLREDRVSEAIVKAGLAGFENAYPKMLSGGMRQRVSLMRTLIMRPGILLMDEPFGALDTHTKLEMHKLLLDVWEAEHQTVMFVTHDLGEAITLSDRVVLLSARPGRVKEVFEVDLPRPRDAVSVRESPQYGALFSKIWHSLGEEFRKGKLQ